MSDTTYRALLIGNSEYERDPDNLPRLKGPPNDLRIMEGVLTHDQIGLHKPENVRVLQDRTRDEILRAASEFFSSPGLEDQLLLYFTGHGWLDTAGNFWLCSRDTSVSELEISAIPDVLIDSMMFKSPARRFVVILDCCHSGKFKGGQLPQTLMGEGRFVLTSSRARELSVDAEKEDECSAFTKYLAEALVSGEVDANQDGYVSINEVYNYVYPKLVKGVGQKPQRHYDEAHGELPLGRSSPKPRVTTPPAEETGRRPILGISETSIEIRDVKLGEKLPDEIIDVFNEGEGRLDWTVECSDDWIQVEKGDGFIRMKLDPLPGVNRGRVYVRDAGRGGSKRIGVVVHVEEEPEKPCLSLSVETVEFGTVSLGADSPRGTVRLNNTGGGELEPRVASAPGWVEARILKNVLEVTLGTSEAGVLRGEIALATAGGDVRIPVSAVVESGPLLEVTPKLVDFGTVTEGESPSTRVMVRNRGGGELEWDVGSRGDFFRTRLTKDAVTVTLDAEPGEHRGSLFVNSSGGQVTVDVHAEVVQKTRTVGDGGFVDISGTWSNPLGGSSEFVGSGPQYSLTEYNIMGIACSEGVAFVQGNTVTVQGQNVIGGQFTAQLTVDGNQMTGFATALLAGMAVPVQLVRA